MDYDIIISDIGGTNGRFATANFSNEGQLPAISNITIYPCTEFSTLEEMLSTYMRSLGKECPSKASLAMAGPTTGTNAKVTNLNWDIERDKLKKQTGLQEVLFLNDFAALGYAALNLTAKDYSIITKNKTGHAGAPISILGPGTGFGLALAVPKAESWRVVATEGGHMSFAPKTQLERDLCLHLSKQMDHISVETLLSGAGLQRIHQFLVTYGGSGDFSLDAPSISSAALRGDSPSCTRAIQLFLSILGSVAGDIALAHGARAGVYIGGGILPKLKSFIPQSDLLERFKSKGKMSHYMQDIPIRIITAETSAFTGAAIAWKTHKGL